MSPGDVIVNRYLLTSLLGEGGMGAVWLARDLRLDIDVALKFIHREVATEQTAERLLQEARAVARLDHPSIVRIFDFGESESGEPFMTMEVLRGELLSEVLERKERLAPPNAVCTLLPVVSAVAAAHAKGIVHRDLKPDNILLVTDDSGSMLPKVLDFGIAMLRTEGRKVKRITQDDAIVGTPDYMPPEQASGIGDVDARADVWAMCVVLYEAITGQRPFEGETPSLVLIAIATKAPVPTTELGAGDEALWRILERGLQKEVADRFQTMRELGTVLARWAVDNGAETDVAGTSLSVHWLTDRMRRPLSEAPAAMPDVLLLDRPASDPDPIVAKPPVPSAPREAPRTGQTWPPRAVDRRALGPSLESLVEPVSLPPELSPERRMRWIWFTAALGALAVVLYAMRDAPALRSLWSSPEPAASEHPAPPPTPTPHTSEPVVHTAEPAPAPRPTTPRPIHKR